MNPNNYKNGLSLVYAITGTFHGALVQAKCEGDARRAFHKVYNGESIVLLKITNIPLI